MPERFRAVEPAIIPFLSAACLHDYIGREILKLKLRSVGTSTGVLLPKEMLVCMKVKKDDTLFAVETPEGYLLTPYDPDVEEQLAKAGSSWQSIVPHFARWPSERAALDQQACADPAARGESCRTRRLAGIAR